MTRRCGRCVSVILCVFVCVCVSVSDGRDSGQRIEESTMCDEKCMLSHDSSLVGHFVDDPRRRQFALRAARAAPANS
jgi:hypothetical protein